MNNYPRRDGKSSTATAWLQRLLVFFITAVSVPTLHGDELCVISQPSAAAVDGIVAPGTSGACSTDSLWQQVGPGAFHPDTSSPVSYIYLARLTSGSDRLRIGVNTAGDQDVSDFDRVVLFFDANNDGAWDDQDFALRIPVSQSNVPISSGSECDLATGPVEYFQRSGSTWVSDAAAAGQVTSRHSYDYDQPDSEDDIWELEIEIPINNSGAFHVNTSGDGFAVGGYVFADLDHLQSPQTGQVLAWPNGVQSNLTSQLPDISGGLAPIQVIEPDAASLANINLENVCFDVSFTQYAWFVNNIQSEPNDEHVNREGQNLFRFSYYFDGPGSTPTPISNPGTAHLKLKPFNTGGVIGPSWEKTQTIGSTPYNYNQLHMTDDFVFGFPGEFGSTANLDFVCADLKLDGFHLDDVSNNNLKNINHNNVQTSEYDQTVLVGADGVPGMAPGKTARLLLNFQSMNEHPELRSVADWSPRFGTDDGGIPWILLLGLLLLVLAIYLFVRRRDVMGAMVPGIVLVAAIVLIIAGLLHTGSKPAPDGGPAVGTDRWQIDNARELGLKSWRDKPGWFEVEVAYGEVKEMNLRFRGQPLRYKPERLRLEPAVEGGPNRVDFPVKPGQVITVLASGGVDVDGEKGPLPPTAAGGFTEELGDPVAGIDTTGEQRVRFFGARPPVAASANTTEEGQAGTAEAATVALAPVDNALAMREAYPLATGYYQPNQFAGALAGWFHGEENQSGAFVLGRSRSVIVPDGVDTLSLFVNAQWPAYATITGFYDITVIGTSAPEVPTRTVPGGDATYRIPTDIPSWMTLTSMNMYANYIDPVVDPNGGLIAETVRPLGAAHFSIYDSHVTQPEGQPGAPNPGGVVAPERGN